MPNIQVASDPAALNPIVAAYIIAQANDAIRARGVFHVALSGGSTPKGLFSLLATDDLLRAQMPWDKTHVWWSDERTVPPDNPDSNYKLANDLMLSRVPVPAENIHRIQGELEPAYAADKYESEIRRILNAPSTIPQFDLLHLGIGPDAHTASIFPGTRAIHESTRLVMSNWIGKLYVWRVTFTPPLINNARAVFFLATGDDKAVPLKGILEGPHEPDQLPAQLVQPASNNLVWFLDQKAAARLSPEILKF